MLLEGCSKKKKYSQNLLIKTKDLSRDKINHKEEKEHKKTTKNLKPTCVMLAQRKPPLLQSPLC